MHSTPLQTIVSVWGRNLVVLFAHGDWCVRGVCAGSSSLAVKSSQVIGILPAYKIADAHCDSSLILNRKYNRVMKSSKAGEAGDCRTQCSAFRGCVFFTYYDDGRCHFSPAGAEAVDAKGTTSGQNCNQAGTDP